MSRGIRIGVDTGGTFTDVVAVDAAGARVATKTPSTPADPAEGFMTGVRKALALLDAGTDDVVAVAHGTTVATNQLLEGKVGDLGFVTTEGFEFLLEIARQSVPDGYGNSYFWVKPPRIVPAHRVRAVGGRLDHTGAEVRPFDEESALAAARFFRDAGVDTVGVCFLHAHADPTHERRMRAVLAAEHPTCAVSLSSDVIREYREYERAVTTLVDAAVKPRVARYVAGIAERLSAAAGRRLPFAIMKSNGGVLSAEEVVHAPVATVLSGPAAGALGAAYLAGLAGYPSVITLDGGGTSTDVSVVLDGAPTLTTEGSVGPYPSKIPMIDVVTVGAGGGSVAVVSRDGRLRVGPASAGADPGPACYGRGGTDVTVTDAHLALGRIPAHLLGGEIPLDVDLAREALTKLAADAGLSLEAAATGILEVSAWNQANAIRQVTVKRGLDVREFRMVTFGGSGSLLACRLVDILGIAGVLVPPDPGNVSAFGLLTVDVKVDYVRTFVARHDAVRPAEIAAVLAELREQAAAALADEGFGPAEARFETSVDLRYYGQAYETRVAAAPFAVDDSWCAAVVAAFHAAHRRAYGYDFAGEDRQVVEWVNLRVSGVGPLPRPTLSPVARGGGDASGAMTHRRPVFFDGWTPAACFDRSRLRAGDRVVGPAVVEEFGSTVPVHPGFVAEVDAWGNLLLGRSA